MDVLRNYFSKQRLLKWLIMLGFFVLIITGVLFLFDQLLMPAYTKHGEALLVPNVIAKDYESAKELLEKHELKVVKGGEKYDANLPFGYVVDQSPRPNRLVKKNRRVYLTISVGEREIEMPHLKGLSETNAIERLKSFGLRLGDIEYEYVIDEPADLVIGQSVAPQAFVKRSDTINLRVSLGSPTANARVPQLFNKPLKIAKREIRKSGLKLGKIERRLDNTVLPNTVIDQSLKAGMEIPRGQKIDLVISRYDGQK